MTKNGSKMEGRGVVTHRGALAAWMGVVVVCVSGVAAQTLMSGKKLIYETPVPRGNHTLWRHVISDGITRASARKIDDVAFHDVTRERRRGSAKGGSASASAGSASGDPEHDFRTSSDTGLVESASVVRSSDVNSSDVGPRFDTISQSGDFDKASGDTGLSESTNSKVLSGGRLSSDYSDSDEVSTDLGASHSGYSISSNRTSCPSDITENNPSLSSNGGGNSSSCNGPAGATTIIEIAEDIPNQGPENVSISDMTSTITAGGDGGSNESTDASASLGSTSSGKTPSSSAGSAMDEWSQCPHLQPSSLVETGFRRAVSRGDRRCARFWCEQVVGSEARHHLGGVYHVVQMRYVAEEDHSCLLNITKMIVLHHSWPMCSSDFVCATNHTTFSMSASDCMPVQCRSAETAVLVFMVLSSVTIVLMSVVIMAVIILCPQFHKPKYYLRFSLAATDFLIGTVVCGHAAYNQWVGMSEVPLERFPYYANLKDGQLFRHVPNCLWGVSDVVTQVSGFFATSGMIISLYTLSLMSLDRYLLLTRTHYRSLVTARRVSAAILMSWCCGLAVPSLHFIYRPQKQHDICVNYDTSQLDVHIINNESKIATADYKVYLMHAVPLGVTLVVVGLPVLALLVFSCRTLRKYNSYTRDRSVRQVKSALQLTQSSLSRQASATSLANMVTLSVAGTPSPAHYHLSRVRTPNHSSSPAYKLKFTSKKRRAEGNGRNSAAAAGLPAASATSSLMENLGADTFEREAELARPSPRSCTEALLGRQSRTAPGGGAAAALAHESELETGTGSAEGVESDGGSVVALSPFRESVLDVLGLRRLLTLHHAHSDHVTATIRRLRGRGGDERLSVRERDREITCTVLVNIVVFMFACFPLLAVGGWMMFLYFTRQDTINNKAPLKQLLFVAPWLMALNSLWNAVLHLTYNHKFRSAACRLIATTWRKLFGVCRRRTRYQE
ncbi:uncharacterized protein LOC122252441 [Penaeus japonicus]|uniref:uncharacterized protein LOC122252441 n=1 Tax=Penaeus japonicus TaxID=27405 RepID=UPI001C7126E1|nr:uncharacterized protein LOC122252441 [Penaeus japonicus]